MLDKIFKQSGQVVLLDRDKLLSSTNYSFVRSVESKINGQSVKGIRMNGDRRQGFLYFKSGNRQYSFAFDKVTRTLAFSEIVRGKWEFIVGYKPL